METVVELIYREFTGVWPTPDVWLPNEFERRKRIREALTAYHAERGRELLHELNAEKYMTKYVNIPRLRAAEAALREAQAKLNAPYSVDLADVPINYKEMYNHAAAELEDAQAKIAELQSSLAAANLTKGLQSSEEGK
jgi:hypothetical protein